MKIYLFIGLLFMSCTSEKQNGNTNLNILEKEDLLGSSFRNGELKISELNTNESKKIFLASILESDQEVRSEEYEAGSKEDREYSQAMRKQDEANLRKIEDYLKKYGYPKKDVLGSEAVMTPWMVIQHQGDILIRNNHFEILYQAYLDGDINEGLMAGYLDRTHIFIYKDYIRLKGSYNRKNEIKQLIIKLGLEERRIKVEQNM